jgi:hypothetical protein
MKTSEIVEDYQRGSLQRVVSRRCELDIIAHHNGKAHVVFGHSHEGECVTYCGLRWWNGHSPTPKQKHCKNCTRELRKAGMSWRWFEVQQFEAPNEKLTQDARP